MTAATHPPATTTAVEVEVSRTLMGGLVTVHLRDGGDPGALERAASRVLDRLAAWASRLSRFEPGSELSRLNAMPGPLVAIGPTMTAVLDWARTAESMTDGLVDVAMLDARLAAEVGAVATRPVAAGRRWSLVRGARGATILREPGVRIDLDGVAKGWLADRALALVPGVTAMVDGDGDVALRVAPGDELAVGVADPRDPDALLAVVRLAATAGRPAAFGVATSGTSVHRWASAAGWRHHLIDPATWRPAETDVVQATVLADSTRVAEAFAKAVVVAGTGAATGLLDRPGIRGALWLTDAGEIRATPGMLPWLA